MDAVPSVAYSADRPCHIEDVGTDIVSVIGRYLSLRQLAEWLRTSKKMAAVCEPCYEQRLRKITLFADERVTIDSLAPTDHVEAFTYCLDDGDMVAMHAMYRLGLIDSLASYPRYNDALDVAMRDCKYAVAITLLLMGITCTSLLHYVTEAIDGIKFIACNMTHRTEVREKERLEHYCQSIGSMIRIFNDRLVREARDDNATTRLKIILTTSGPTECYHALGAQARQMLWDARHSRVD